jgi:hypothetical protein
MPATNHPQHATPAQLATVTTLVEFGAMLKALREGIGLRQTSFQGIHRGMSDSAVSRAGRFSAGQPCRGGWFTAFA